MPAGKNLAVTRTFNVIISSQYFLEIHVEQNSEENNLSAAQTSYKFVLTLFSWREPNSSKNGFYGLLRSKLFWKASILYKNVNAVYLKEEVTFCQKYRYTQNNSGTGQSLILEKNVCQKHKVLLLMTLNCKTFKTVLVIYGLI